MSHAEPFVLWRMRVSRDVCSGPAYRIDSLVHSERLAQHLTLNMGQHDYWKPSSDVKKQTRCITENNEPEMASYF